MLRDLPELFTLSARLDQAIGFHLIERTRCDAIAALDLAVNAGDAGNARVQNDADGFVVDAIRDRDHAACPIRRNRVCVRASFSETSSCTVAMANNSATSVDLSLIHI